VHNQPFDLVVTPWHLDEPMPRFPIPRAAGTVVIDPSSPPGSQVDRLLDRYRVVADTTAQTERPLLLAGDCLTAVAAVAGLQRQHRDLALVWLDGHGDFNTPAITISGYLGGMSLAMLTGRSPEPLCDPLGVRAIPEQRAVLIDARELDPAEDAAIRSSQVSHIAADPTQVRQAMSELHGAPVYLHVDADVVDGDELPGLRFPAGGGPALAQVEECLTEIVSGTRVVAACIACTWSPERVGDDEARRAITRIGAAVGAELHWDVGGS
jgi:arginase